MGVEAQLGRDLFLCICASVVCDKLGCIASRPYFVYGLTNVSAEM